MEENKKEEPDTQNMPILQPDEKFPEISAEILNEKLSPENPENHKDHENNENIENLIENTPQKTENEHSETVKNDPQNSLENLSIKDKIVVCESVFKEICQKYTKTDTQNIKIEEIEKLTEEISKLLDFDFSATVQEIKEKYKEQNYIIIDNYYSYIRDWILNDRHIEDLPIKTQDENISKIPITETQENLNKNSEYPTPKNSLDFEISYETHKEKIMYFYVKKREK